MDLTLHEKIGQLIVPRLDLQNPDLDYAEYLVREFGIGGFIVFGGTVESVADSLNRLQRISKLPLLFSADLERGLGQQVSGATSFPYFMGLGEAAKRSSTQLIYDASRITALESRAVGIHMNFSPVLDINNNRDNPIINIRSFGEDAETVTSCSSAYIRGLQEGGMLAAGKHFPGHGDTTVDSHSELPALAFSSDELEHRELRPFKNAVSEGVDAVMVGHIAVPSLDPSGLPASMSKEVITGLLRKSWHYDGLVVTDALMMGAIINHFSEEESVVRVFEAGVDQLLMPLNIERTHRLIKDLVRDKPDVIDRLERSVQRIVTAKGRLGLFENRFVDPLKAGTIVACGRHTACAESLIRKCFIVKKGNGFSGFGAKDAEIWLIKTDPQSLSAIRSSGKDVRILESELRDEKAFIPEFEPGRRLIVITDVKPMAWQKKHILPERIAAAIEKAFASKEHLLISCGNPYIADTWDCVNNFVCTYDNSPSAQQEILRNLL